MDMLFFEDKMALRLFIPKRTCIGCFKKFPQQQLLSVTRLKDGSAHFDLQQRLSGRSVYLCHNLSCFLRATKRKGKNAFSYGLKVDVPREVLDDVQLKIKNLL